MSSNCTSAIELPVSSLHRLGRTGSGDPPAGDHTGRRRRRRRQPAAGPLGARGGAPARPPQGDRHDQPPARAPRGPSGIGVGGDHRVDTLLGPRRARGRRRRRAPAASTGPCGGPDARRSRPPARPPVVQGGGEELEPALVVLLPEGHQLVHPLVGAQRPTVVAPPADELPGPELGDPGMWAAQSTSAAANTGPEDVVDRGLAVEGPDQVLDGLLGVQIGAIPGVRVGRRHGPEARTGAACPAPSQVPWPVFALTPRTVSTRTVPEVVVHPNPRRSPPPTGAVIAELHIVPPDALVVLTARSTCTTSPGSSRPSTSVTGAASPVSRRPHPRRLRQPRGAMNALVGAAARPLLRSGRLTVRGASAAPPGPRACSSRTGGPRRHGNRGVTRPRG